MAVFRVEKIKDYTIMSNHHLRNVDLSLKAKGLMSLILSSGKDSMRDISPFAFKDRCLSCYPCRRIGTIR